MEISESEYQKQNVNIGEEYLPFGKPNFSIQEIEAVSQVMQTGWIGMGNHVIEFEKELATYLNVPFVVTVDSCTSALFLSVLVSGIRQGDEVICPSLTWCSSANSVLYNGAKIVFCDNDNSSLCVTSKTILEKVTPKTKAVVVVHYAGFAIDVIELRKELPANILIIEDAAHAFGAKYPNGNMVGASGNLTCFSFYANKNLSTGEGGAIAVFDEDIANKLRSLRQNGMPISAWNRFTNPKAKLYTFISQLGYKMNYIDLHATIGRVQLKRFSEFQNTRLRVAQIYYNRLSTFEPEIYFQKDILDNNHARHLFIILLPIEKMKIDRDDFMLHLRDRNIGASIHYSPLHLMPFYQTGLSLPIAENVFKRILTLPISASLTDGEANYIIDNFIDIFNNSLK